MGKRLNQDRQEKLEPERYVNAFSEIRARGYLVYLIEKHSFCFDHKGHPVKYFPYTGWATGKSIQDGRGLKNLLKQLDK